jgi:RNA polymerase sigma factor (TIGR02999 family)
MRCRCTRWNIRTLPTIAQWGSLSPSGLVRLDPTGILRNDIDQLIEAAGRGDRSALESVLPFVYQELRSIARHRLAGERAGHTLQVTDLVHEAYLKLACGPGAVEPRWSGRPHFFALAARVMRNVLIDYARSRAAEKRGGEFERVTLATIDAGVDADSEAFELDALDRALSGLAAHDARAASIVELRYFGGMTIDEVAQALGIAPATVKRDWTYASAWLRRAMSN